jgi:ribosomal protein S18 acetylase RimI-like enzyme
MHFQHWFVFRKVLSQNPPDVFADDVMQTYPKIRNAKPDDIEKVAAIENRCFDGPTAYPKAQLSYLIYKANSTSLIEEYGDAIRGFIVVLYRRGTKVAGIETLDVDPQHQKQGVGMRLLSAAEEEMKKRSMQFSQLEVSVGNTAALALYKKMGYTQKMRLPNYYQYPHHGSHDAVRMIKQL